MKAFRMDVSAGVYIYIYQYIYIYWYLSRNILIDLIILIDLVQAFNVLTDSVFGIWVILD